MIELCRMTLQNKLIIKTNTYPIGNGKWLNKKDKTNGELKDHLLRTLMKILITKMLWTNKTENLLPGKPITKQNLMQVNPIKRKLMLGEANCISLNLPSGKTFQNTLFPKDKETVRTFPRRLSMLKSMV